MAWTFVSGTRSVEASVVRTFNRSIMYRAHEILLLAVTNTGTLVKCLSSLKQSTAHILANTRNVLFVRASYSSPDRFQYQQHFYAYAVTKLKNIFHTCVHEGLGNNKIDQINSQTFLTKPLTAQIQ